MQKERSRRESRRLFDQHLPLVHDLPDAQVLLGRGQYTVEQGIGQEGPDLVLDDLYTLNCDQLWYQRNSIFKAARYSFRTPRGIRVFGNVGCMYDNEYDVPLSDVQSRGEVGRVEFEASGFFGADFADVFVRG